MPSARARTTTKPTLLVVKIVIFTSLTGGPSKGKEQGVVDERLEKDKAPSYAAVN